MKKLIQKTRCLLLGHKWNLIHEEGDWILHTAKYIWECEKCESIRVAKPWKA